MAKSVEKKFESGQIQSKFTRMRKVMNDALIERSEEIDMVGTALLCQEHAMLVGSPGVAKSMLVNALGQWIQTKPFTVHLSKDTDRNMVFGPVKVTSLLKDQYDRILDGGAANCRLLILEECFKSGPAVLDMLLLLLNERIYREGMVEKDCPLMFALATSNEWNPEGCEAGTAAFFDRFLFRKTVKPISTRKGRVTLLWKQDLEPKFSEHITPEEIHQGTKEAAGMEYTQNAMDAMEQMIIELNTAGIMPGDRRLRKAVKAARAYAYLMGGKKVEPEHLEILTHVLWDDPSLDSTLKCARIVAKCANPVGMQINDLKSQAESIMRIPVNTTTEITEAHSKLKNLRDSLSSLNVELRNNLKLTEAVDFVESHMQELGIKLLGM